MPDVMCAETMELLALVAGAGIISNDGHEILARLEAGDDAADIVEDLGGKFGKPRLRNRMRKVVESWPPLHREAVAEIVRWALTKLDTDDRVMLQWKGDAEHPETVTRLELRDHTLSIEFAHPPFTNQAARAGA